MEGNSFRYYSGRSIHQLKVSINVPTPLPLPTVSLVPLVPCILPLSAHVLFRIISLQVAVCSGLYQRGEMMMSKPSDSFPVPLLSPRQVFVVDIRPSSSDLTALGTCLSSGSQRQKLVSVQTFFSLSPIHLGEFIPLAQSMHRSGSYSLKTFSYTHSLSIVIFFIVAQSAGKFPVTPRGSRKERKAKPIQSAVVARYPPTNLTSPRHNQRWTIPGQFLLSDWFFCSSL